MNGNAIWLERVVMELHKEILDIIGGLEFGVTKSHKHHSGGCFVELNQYTPEGEDWWVSIVFDGTDIGFCNAVNERYEDFDVDEEVEAWIYSRGKNGVPSSVRALLQDAEWKEQKLCLLADALNDWRHEYELPFN